METDLHNFPACKINNTPPLSTKDSDDEMCDITSTYPMLEFFLCTSKKTLEILHHVTVRDPRKQRNNAVIRMLCPKLRQCCMSSENELTM